MSGQHTAPQDSGANLSYQVALGTDSMANCIEQAVEVTPAAFQNTKFHMLEWIGVDRDLDRHWRLLVSASAAARANSRRD